MKQKALGQNFLIHKGFIEKIVQLSDDSYSVIVEIGPGQGALTSGLYRKPAKLILLEKDDSLIKNLQQQFPKAEIILGDACETLKHTPKESLLISNLPYSTGTAILLSALEHQNFPKMILMFQKEVAERISARVGNADRGSLSVIAQNYYDIERSYILPPEAFFPKPKIYSQVLIFKKKIQPDFSMNFSKLTQHLKHIFMHPRKMLGKRFSQFSLIQKKRPHELSVEELKMMLSHDTKET